MFPFSVSQFTNENKVNKLKYDSFGVNCITNLPACPKAKKCAYLFIGVSVCLFLFVCFFVS